MLKFMPLTEKNDGDLVSGIYLHGTIECNTDLVTTTSDIPKISQYYNEGQALDNTLYDIKDGIHNCYVGSVPCTLYSWKVISICPNSSVWFSKGNKELKYDMRLVQRGLICLPSDKKANEEALRKYLNREYII